MESHLEDHFSDQLFVNCDEDTTSYKQVDIMLDMNDEQDFNQIININNNNIEIDNNVFSEAAEERRTKLTHETCTAQK